ncbi:hypothetical protein P8C59_006433 [Phyllachora maydis]|uniref:Uncharacterized protein n=1 Tax=Phyllachora maydis TaxID=1825666 RepID=A0AAD9I6R2_9PEZI|nr:hypothetical protein P8C59_006433 [Phyllachora maydis]
MADQAKGKATSNLDPPIDIGSKEGFKDTITSSIVKELSKKAYTIPDNKESRNPAIETYRAAYIANSSNSTPHSNSNHRSYNLAIEEEEEESDSSSNSSSSSDSDTQLEQLLALKEYKKRKDFKGKGLKTSSNKAKYKDNKPRRRPRDPALYNSWLYNIGSTDHISNSKERFTTPTPNIGLLRPINTGNGPISPASIGSITLEVLFRKAPPTYTKLVLDNVLYLPNININIRNKIVVEIPSRSISKEDYRPVIEDTIVSKAIEPKKRYKLRNSPAKGTTLEGIGPSLRWKRPYRPTREPKPLTGTRDLPRVLREPVIEGNQVVEKAIASPTLKEPNIVLKTSTVKFIEDNIVLSHPTDNTALEGELVDLDLDLKGAISPDPSNLNTEKPISIEIGPSKLEPYKSSFDSELDEPLPDKPINPVIVESTRPTISIRKPELPEAFPKTIEPIITPKPIEVIAPN